MRLIFLIVIMFVSINNFLCQVSGKWQSKKDLPENMLTLTVVVNGQIFCIRGGAIKEPKKNGTISIYDPVKETFTKIAELPVCKVAFGAVNMNNKICIVGGITGNDEKGNDIRSASVEVFDPANKTWAQIEDMITGVHFPAVAVYNSRIIVTSAYGNSNIKCIVQEYDPATGKWTRKADSPLAGFYWGTAVVNDKLYCIDEKGKVVEFDYTTNVWTKKNSAMSPRSEFGCCMVNNKILTFGGWTSKGKEVSNIAEVYDPVLDKWEKLDNMPTAKYMISPAFVGNKIYILGGMITGWGSPAGSTSNASVEFYELTALQKE